ncbi:glycosyltransferase [Saccharothrix algeriensis]|uniref:Glycosyltransferase involved in cell wall biosynthesis n=3 Tax=Saccharothrix algeriensis TaxID=173560 RepID=A0ABS2S1T2_9PSEU|nr:glycosyltransferase [Saccharothrix algeriensis]MBM7809869.1 glycosyltransferase involved in cell wall biosynthesis [Saccharothrix algeriensis]
MRISMVSLSADPLAAPGDGEAGGLCGHLGDLCPALAAAGHDVEVHTLARDGEHSVAEVPPGFRVVRLPVTGHRAAMPDPTQVDLWVSGAEVPVQGPRPGTPAPDLADVVEHLRDRWAGRPPDVVHAHGWTSALVALAAAAATPVPVLVSPHGAHPGGGEAVRRRAAGSGMARAVGCRVAGVLTAGPFQTGRLVDAGLHRADLLAVPYGVDTDLFNPDGPAAPRTARHRLLAAGRLVDHDGLGRLVAALGALPDTELVVVGGPAGDAPDHDPAARALAEAARRAGAHDRVHLLGRVPRAAMPALLRSADVVVCPARHQPLGLLALEAMACGVPVVATTAGVLPDLVVHGATGLLVPSGDTAALTRELRALLADTTRREAYGAAAADRVHARYTLARTTADTVNAYRQVRARPPRAGSGVATTSGPRG